MGVPLKTPDSASKLSQLGAEIFKYTIELPASASVAAKVYEYPEYNFSKGQINCNEFIKPTKNQVTLKLSVNEKKEKIKLLEIYNSEKKNLDYIHLEKECYRELYHYDYSKPPHIGKLFYRRFSFFSWHPRVDSDTPEKIIKKLLTQKFFE